MPNDRYGNVGKSGEAAIVYSETFRLAKDNANVSFPGRIPPFRNAVGETLAHEIGHKLAVPHNIQTSPYTLMTDGTLVPSTAHARQCCAFLRDVTIMQKICRFCKAMPRTTTSPNPRPLAPPLPHLPRHK